MGKVIRLTESQLKNVIKRVIKESEQNVEAEQAMSEINSMFKSAGLPVISLITLIGADDSMLESMEKKYSIEPEPTMNKNVDIKGIKEKVINYYCSLRNNRKRLFVELGKLINLRNSKKPIKEGIGESDLIWVVGSAIMLVVLLISRINRRRNPCSH